MDFQVLLNQLNPALMAIVRSDLSSDDMVFECHRLVTESGYTAEAFGATTRSPQDLLRYDRLRVFVYVNHHMRNEHGNYASGQDPAVLEAFPAQRLIRTQTGGPRIAWRDRWQQAGEASGFPPGDGWILNTKTMAAVKNHPIWDRLGDTTIFPDALGNPFAPFRIDQVMGTEDIDHDAARRMGLLARGIPAPVAVGPVPFLPIEDVRLTNHFVL